MIRKAVIVILSLAAIATLALDIMSVRTHIGLGPLAFHRGTCQIAQGVLSDPELPRQVRVVHFEEYTPGEIYPSHIGWEYFGVHGRPLPGPRAQTHRSATLAGFGYVVLRFHNVVCFEWRQPSELAVTLVNGTGKGTLWFAILHLPLWFLLTALATYPATAFIRGPLRRWRWRRKGLCLKCGYNLTGNVSGVCPECGEVT